MLVRVGSQAFGKHWTHREPLTVNVLENLAKTYEALGKREDASSVSYRASSLGERLKM